MKLFITKSKRKNKTYNLLDGNKNIYCLLAMRGLKTILCIKTLIEKKDISTDIKNEKYGLLRG